MNADYEIEFLRTRGLDDTLDCGVITETGYFYGFKLLLAAEDILDVHHENKHAKNWIQISTEDGWRYLQGHAPEEEINAKLLATLKDLGYDPYNRLAPRNTDIHFKDVYSEGYKEHPFPRLEKLRSREHVYRRKFGVSPPAIPQASPSTPLDPNPVL